MKMTTTTWITVEGLEKKMKSFNKMKTVPAKCFYAYIFQVNLGHLCVKDFFGIRSCCDFYMKAYSYKGVNDFSDFIRLVLLR
mmetsp:Transcript_28665/g.42451  ORF Transcript_28665/g.42451 Transcript_28665/m.42451 type:complete len:82 (-) Transcript_28665:325-570(-)